MKFSIKNWIIKKLGGYTKDEYHNTEEKVVVLRTYPIRLEASFCDTRPGLLSSNQINDILAEKFLPQIKATMKVDKIHNLPGKTSELYVAYITLQMEEIL